MSGTRDTALAFMRALWASDPAACDALLAHDARWIFQPGMPHAAERGRIWPARAALARIVDDLFTAFDPQRGFDVEVLSAIAEGDEAAIEYRATGWLKDGRAYENFYCARLTVEHGRVAELRPYNDTRHMLDALMPGAPTSALPEAAMATHELINPPTLFDPRPYGYTQVAVAAPGRLVALAGQAAIGADGVPIGGSFEGQVALAFDNVRLALAAAGCIPADAIQVRIYVVDLDPAKIDPIKAALADLFGDDGPPDSLIGVAALAMPELHIEIEVLAVRPEHRA